MIVQNHSIWNNPGKINEYHKPSSRANEFKPVKAGETSAHVVFILDDSGSMQSCRQQTINGFNEFLAGQAESEVPTYVSLYKFDGSKTVQMYTHTPVSLAPKLNIETYNPQGGTNLLDSMGDVMIKVNQELASIGKSENRDSITIVVLTDGEENSSREFTNADIKGIIEKSEAQNWGFFFLGANIDAFSVGSSLGFGVQNTLQYNTANMGQTMGATTRAVNSMKSARAAGYDTAMSYASATYTEEERKEVI